MERMMIVMIALVAIVAVGGLLYIGVHQAPGIVPVFIQGPVLQGAEGSSASSAPGQIRFTTAPISASAGGQVKFSMK